MTKGEIRLYEMIFHNQANHYGTLFAGNGLALMAKGAVMAASRHAGKDVVMAAVDKVRFHAPIRVGEFLDMTANVTRVGRTSMTVNVAAHAEKPGGSNRRAVMEGQFEMVAVDENGRPSAIERPS